MRTIVFDEIIDGTHSSGSNLFYHLRLWLNSIKRIWFRCNDLWHSLLWSKRITKATKFWVLIVSVPKEEKNK